MSVAGIVVVGVADGADTTEVGAAVATRRPIPINM